MPRGSESAFSSCLCSKKEKAPAGKQNSAKLETFILCSLKVCHLGNTDLRDRKERIEHWKLDKREDVHISNL